MGGRGVREKVLSDKKVIDEVNRSFIPLYVDVKKDHLPDLAAFKEMPADHRRCITGTAGLIGRGFNRAFYARSWVISPDGERLLNRKPRWNHEETPDEYLKMLAGASEDLTLLTRRS